MKTYWKFPYYSLSSDELKIILDNEEKRKRLEDKSPLEKGLTIRYVEIYLDKKELIYIVQDWEKDKSGRVKTESFFAKDL